MGGDWFGWWVSVYVKATGAGADVAALLVENEGVILSRWHATREELDECADRLIAGGRVPRWPNEHTNALHAELVRLREERASEGRAAPPGDFPPDCDACGGSGLATVPVRACVWQGRLILHPELKRVLTGAVLCDRHGCEAGRVARERESARKDNKPRRPTLARAERAAGCDLVRLLRDHERQEAERSRRELRDRGEQPWADAGVLPNLAALAAGIFVDARKAA